MTKRKSFWNGYGGNRLLSLAMADVLPNPGLSGSPTTCGGASEGQVGEPNAVRLAGTSPSRLWADGKKGRHTVLQRNVRTSAIPSARARRGSPPARRPPPPVRSGTGASRRGAMSISPFRMKSTASRNAGRPGSSWAPNTVCMSRRLRKKVSQSKGTLSLVGGRPKSAILTSGSTVRPDRMIRSLPELLQLPLS